MKTETAMGKRVVVLYRRSLLTQTVEGLLKGRMDLEVIGVDLDHKGAIGQVEQAHPECIIVDDADLPETWSHLSFQLWRENPRIKFVYLNMSQNSAEVVGGRRVVVNSMKDLVRVLKHR
jgi:DNA-binding NarL/FixJ family response regulator